MVTINDINIEKLQSKHQQVLKKFQCYEKELVDFLIEDALDNQEKKISTTHLWFLKGKRELIGYITLLNDKINLEGTLKHILGRKESYTNHCLH